MRFRGSFTNNRKTLIFKHSLNLAMREYMSIQKIKQTIGNSLLLCFTSQGLNISLPLALGSFSCRHSRIRIDRGVSCWSRSVGHWVAAARDTQEVLSDYLQCETSLKQEIIILGHCPFFALACLSVTKTTMAGHASHSSLHHSADNYISNLGVFSPGVPSANLRYHR